jgi:hypothetical protein
VQSNVRGDWLLIFDYLLRQDPFFLIVAEKRSRGMRDHRQPVGSLDITADHIVDWQPTDDDIDSIIAAVLLSDDLGRKVVTSEQVRTAIKGPPHTITEYGSIDINGANFCTTSYQNTLATTHMSRDHCFYENDETRQQFDSDTEVAEDVNYPLVRIKRIFVVESCCEPALARSYTLLRVLNFEKRSRDPTSMLWKVKENAVLNIKEKTMWKKTKLKKHENDKLPWNATR